MHRNTKLMARLIGIAVAVLALTAGCQSVKSGRLVETPDVFKGMTKSEVYQKVGLPEKITYVGDTTYLYYNGTMSKGGGVLLGNPAVLTFYFGRTGVGSDTQMLKLEGDRVVEVNSHTRTGDLSWSFWPF